MEPPIISLISTSSSTPYRLLDKPRGRVVPAVWLYLMVLVTILSLFISLHSYSSIKQALNIRNELTGIVNELEAVIADYNKIIEIESNDRSMKTPEPLYFGNFDTQLPYRFKRSIGNVEERTANLESKASDSAILDPNIEHDSLESTVNGKRSADEGNYNDGFDTTAYFTNRNRLVVKSIDMDTPNANSEPIAPIPNTPRDRNNPCRNNQKHPRRQTNARLETMDEGPPVKCDRSTKAQTPVAIHYAGSTADYILGKHDRYKGNGRLQHQFQKYVDWKTADWVDNMGMDKYFNMNEGELTVSEQGLYLIYAQIHYLDVQDTQAYRVYRNGREILQCTTMTHTNHSVMKSNTCYTSALEYLHVNDRLTIGDLARNVHSLFEPGKSFFGLVKLGDKHK